MKMKTIYLWLLTAIVLCGCSDFLDREPKTNLSPASFGKRFETGHQCVLSEYESFVYIR